MSNTIYCFTTNTYKQQGLYKVGEAKRHVSTRLSDFNVAYPEPIILIGDWEVDSISDKAIHSFFRYNGIRNAQGEWFYLDNPTVQIEAAIDYYVQQSLQIQVPSKVETTSKKRSKYPNTHVRVNRYGEEVLWFSRQVPDDLRCLVQKAKVSKCLGDVSQQTLASSIELNKAYSRYFDELRQQIKSGNKVGNTDTLLPI